MRPDLEGDPDGPGLSPHTPASRRRLALAFCLILLLSGALFFYRLGGRDLWSSHEGRAAQDAQTILAEGGWGLPHLFDARYLELQKPPLYYWLVAASARLRGHGVDACDVRLPATLAGFAGVAGIYLLAARRGRPIAGLFAAGSLATIMHYTLLARTGRIDMPLAFTTGLALSCFYLSERRGRETHGQLACLWLLPGYIALAVGLLLKGPVAAILPGCVAGSWLLFEGHVPAPWRWRQWLGLAHAFGLWWGIPLVVALACPWYIWAQWRTGGEFGRTFFWYHNVERALGSGGLRAHPWWFYGPRLTFDLLPWTPVLVAAGIWLARRQRWRMDAEARFGAVWLVVMVAVLSCARFKRADYLVPAYPGAALLLGCACERWARAARARAWVPVGFAAVVLGTAACWWVQLTWFLPAEDARRQERTFAAAIRRIVPTPETVILFRLEDHLLAFHLGRPLYTLLEWENLDAWASRPQPVYVVMTPEMAAASSEHLRAGQLVEVFRNSDFSGGSHERPLIFFRTCPCHW